MLAQLAQPLAQYLARVSINKNCVVLRKGDSYNLGWLKPCRTLPRSDVRPFYKLSGTQTTSQISRQSLSQISFPKGVSLTQFLLLLGGNTLEKPAQISLGNIAPISFIQ